MAGDQEERLIQKKVEWARTKRGLTGQTLSPEERVPPGQHLVKNFPILDLGIRPRVPLEKWQLAVSGLVENPITWTWQDFLAQPKIVNVSDFHCVTTWSQMDNAWEGVSFRHLLSVVKPEPEARFVLFGSSDGYTTNLPFHALDDDDVLLAFMWNGQPLPVEHGGPVRMVVPKRYGWKSAKWVKEIVFVEKDVPGFWEVRGYSNTADPWTEDRYS